jgi:hypothetical protein
MLDGWGDTGCGAICDTVTCFLASAASAMGGLLLISIVFALVGIPAIGAGDTHARRGMKRTVLVFVGFTFLYATVVTWVYAAFFSPATW